MTSRRHHVFLLTVAGCFVEAWIATANGAESLARSFLIRSWQSEDGLPSNVIRDIAHAADGYLWIASAEGVIRFDGARFSNFSRDEDVLLAQRQPRALFALPTGDVWISTVRGGLLQWNGKQFRAVWDEEDASNPATRIPLLTEVVADGDKGVFIQRGDAFYYTRDGVTLRQMERTPELVRTLAAAGEARAQRSSTTPGGGLLRLRDRRGQVWTATPGQGLTVSKEPDPRQTAALPDFTSELSINALLECPEGNLWIATGGNGLFQIRPRRIEVFGMGEGLKDRTVFTIMEDGVGALWAANKSGGIDRIRGGQIAHFEVGDGGPNRPVSALCEDQEGRLWAATRNGSVFRFENERFRLMTSSALPISKVLAMAKDPLGRLWFGGSQGLAMLASGTLTRYGPEAGISAQNVTALAAEPSGALLVGTEDGKVFRGVDGRFSLLGTTGPRAVSAFLPDGDESFWTTTLGDGLFRWRDGRFVQFAERDGLPEPRLTSVLDDGTGHLWLGSLAGIIRVAKGQLVSRNTGERPRPNWLLLDRSDGMLSRECTGAFQPAAWRSRDGTLSFPTVNGIALVRSGLLEVNQTPPHIVIEEARVGDRRIHDPPVPFRVGPGRSRLEFRYAALSFTAPQKVRFLTRLEGMEDSEWQDAGLQRTASYEAVPPGRYRFAVRATNGDGVWSEIPTTLAVEVVPHFWETTWFRGVALAAAAALAAALGWMIARARMRGRLMRLELQTSREKERARIAQDLHDDLGASLTEISMLAQLATEEENRGREPLREIAGKAHHLVGALDEIVWAVNPRHDTLASLVDYLAAFAAEFLGAVGISLRRDIPQEIPAVSLDAEKRHSLFLATREALNNVVKHSGATEVRLHLSIGDHELKLAVQDNGHGLALQQHEFSEGLRSMEERLSRIGGACRIESSANGADVYFTVPIGMRT